MGQPDFRVAGMIFATLASASTSTAICADPAQQTASSRKSRSLSPIPGGWGLMGIDPHPSRRAARTYCTAVLHRMELRVERCQIGQKKRAPER